MPFVILNAIFPRLVSKLEYENRDSLFSCGNRFFPVYIINTSSPSSGYILNYSKIQLFVILFEGGFKNEDSGRKACISAKAVQGP